MRLLSLVFILLSLITTNVFADSHEKTLTISDGWVRMVPPVAENTAGYFKLSNATDKVLTLVGAESPVARHSDMHDMVNEDGQMSMEHMPEVVVKPGETVKFAPGGKHLMLMGLKAQLKMDQKVTVTFIYKSGAKQTLELPVKMMGMKSHNH